MKVFYLDFTNTEHFKDYESMILFRPTRSRIFRACWIPKSILDNKEWVQVFNTLSIHKGPKDGMYYFHVPNFERFSELSQTFAHMELPHHFAEPEISGDTVSSEVQQHLN